MSWLIAQSLPSILLALALGLILGWLIWGTSWNQVRTTKQAILGQLQFTHQRELADREAQVDVVRAELDEERDENAALVARLRRELAVCRGESLSDVSTGALASVPPSAARAVPERAAFDDLQRIDGIGPAIAAALRRADIDSLSALGQARVDDIAIAVAEAGLRSVPGMPSWPAQARLLSTTRGAAIDQLAARSIAPGADG